MMTEAEAKTKWCPFARVGLVTDDDGGVAVNRSVEPVDKRTVSICSVYDETRCIAAACMAWRWDESEWQTMDSLRGPKPEGEGWEQITDAPVEAPITRWRRIRQDRKGLCGLARG